MSFYRKTPLKKITFIIGAGASKPYGMQTGHDLRNEILSIDCSNYDEKLTSIFLSLNLDKFYNNSLRDDEKREVINFETPFFQEFLLSFKKSNVSIDSFISTCESRGNDRFSKFGKSLIVYLLSQRESLVFDNFNNLSYSEEAIVPKLVKDDWIAMLLDRIKCPEGDIDVFLENLNKFQFITFNYDRILEISILNHASSMYGEEHLERVYKKINIIHMYGSLGDIQFSQAGGFDFSRKLSKYIYNFKVPYILNKLSSSIDIMYKNRAEKHKESIFKMLTNSDAWYFLGFSFDLYNVENLGIQAIKPEIYLGKTIISSTDIGIHQFVKDSFLGMVKKGEEDVFKKGAYCSDILSQMPI